jgi:hypothetical protein
MGHDSKLSLGHWKSADYVGTFLGKPGTILKFQFGPLIQRLYPIQLVWQPFATPCQRDRGKLCYSCFSRWVANSSI